MHLETIEAIYHAFDGKLVGKPILKSLICEAVLLLPEETRAFVTAHCWFIGNFVEAWGFTIKGEDIKDDYLIILSEDLFAQSADHVYATVLHEIGHVVLGHRNSIKEIQTQSEITQQEREADAFAARYLP